jgi:hypothetical protein
LLDALGWLTLQVVGSLNRLTYALRLRLLNRLDTGDNTLVFNTSSVTVTVTVT